MRCSSTMTSPSAFPKLGVMIYHNPTHHRVTIPVGAFKKITQKPNIIGMKDSHRTPLQFIELMNTVKGKISVFVNQTQAYPYAMRGASGCWSFNVWMGPSPVVALREACAGILGSRQTDLSGLGWCRQGGANIGNLSWRENVFKLSVDEAVYCTAGPLRSPCALCLKRSSTTVRKSPPIGRRCAKISGRVIGEDRISTELRISTGLSPRPRGATQSICAG